MSKIIKLLPDYEIGEIVFSKLGGEEPRGMITGIMFRNPENLEYEVTWPSKTKNWCQREELMTSEEYENFKVINGY